MSSTVAAGTASPLRALGCRRTLAARGAQGGQSKACRPRRDVDETLDEFAWLTGPTGRALTGLRSRIERRTFPEVDDLWQSEPIAEAHDGTTGVLRILSDAAVTSAIARFADASFGLREPLVVDRL